MLWGRLPLLRALAANIQLSYERSNLIWIDMGGGTGWNVEKMSQVYPLEKFKKIYIVDLCPSMCHEARKRVLKNGWTNVDVVCTDVCDFQLADEYADMITFSYSISMIPTFYKAIDHAYELLGDDGFIGVTDFYTPEKYDTRNQMHWVSRMFWLSLFDLDNIKLGPERRQYLEYKFETLYDYNTSARLPYLMMKAPYYIWIGVKHERFKRCSNVMIKRTKAPALFPPTFLYHQSWEDPDVDHKVLDISSSDVCLTLTSGGCNALNLLLKGAQEVVSVDVNPAQTALLELKCVAIKYLNYDDFWKMFGEGKHEDFNDIFDNKLAPFLSESSRRFWERKRHYFKDGLYYHGSMGKISKVIQLTSSLLGISDEIKNVVEAQTLEQQIAQFESLVKTVTFQSDVLNSYIEKIISMLALNRTVAWFAGGVPKKQFQLIKDDGTDILSYFKRCIINMLYSSHINSENYFYYNLFMGRYTKECCPAYLKQENFNALKDGLIDNIRISSDFFLNELRQRKYDKVILMDHADWQSQKQTIELAKTLYDHVNHGGKIIFRSAGLIPPYVSHLQDVGFRVTCLDRIDRTGYMDRVNMYASFYVCDKD
jgi:betaine lipid synthase